MSACPLAVLSCRLLTYLCVYPTAALCLHPPAQNLTQVVPVKPRHGMPQTPTLEPSEVTSAFTFSSGLLLLDDCFECLVPSQNTQLGERFLQCCDPRGKAACSSSATLC